MTTIKVPILRSGQFWVITRGKILRLKQNKWAMKCSVTLKNLRDITHLIVFKSSIVFRLSCFQQILAIQKWLFYETDLCRDWYLYGSHIIIVLLLCRWGFCDCFSRSVIFFFPPIYRHVTPSGQPCFTRPHFLAITPKPCTLSFLKLVDADGLFVIL